MGFRLHGALFFAALIFSSYAVKKRQTESDLTKLHFCNQTDVIFVVQNNEVLEDQGLVNMLQYIAKLVNAYTSSVPASQAASVRFALVHYHSDVIVAFDLDDGYDLTNPAAVSAAVMSISYLGSPGANLAGALMQGQDMLMYQSNPSYNHVVIVMSDGIDVNNPDYFQGVSNWFFTSFVSVIVIGIDENTDVHNLRTLVHMDDAHLRIIDVDDFDFLEDDLEGLLRWNSLLICRYFKFCFIMESICSKTCGIGAYTATYVCIIYVDGNAMDERRYSAENKCCMQKCRLGGGNGERITSVTCKDLPPGGTT